MTPVEDDLVRLLYKPDQWLVTPNQAEHRRRSIYLTAKRNLQLPFFQVLDQPDSQISCPRREMSTHALQALELFNGEFSNRLAGDLAARLECECGADRDRLIERAFLLVAGRPPSRQEADVAGRFIDEMTLTEFSLTLFNLNAFIYVN
jgi:hypothetical protein